MNYIRFIFLRLLAVFALSMAAATPAHAQWAVIDAAVNTSIQQTSQQIVQAVNRTTAAVNSASSAINQNLNYWFREVVMAQKASASSIGQVVKETGTLQGQTAIAISQNAQFRDNERRFQVTNPCTISAPSQGMSDTLRAGSVAVGGAGRGSGGAQRTASGGNSALAKSLDIAEGRVPAPAPEVSAALAAAGACGSFAAGGQRAEACSAAQLQTGNANGHPDADVIAATLLDGPQTNPATPRKRFTVDMTKDSAEEKAVAAFLRNLNTPLELRALSKGELATDAGRRYLSVKDSYEGRMSLADAANKRQATAMAANPSTIAMLRDLMSANGDPAFVGAYLARQAPNWQTKGVSADEVMNLEVERRYMNLEWNKRVVSMFPEEVAREQLRVAALQNVLLWRLNQEMRLNGVLLGNLYASQVRQESLPEMKAAHSAATR